MKQTFFKLTLSCENHITFLFVGTHCKQIQFTKSFRTQRINSGNVDDLTNFLRGLSRTKY